MHGSFFYCPFLFQTQFLFHLRHDVVAVLRVKDGSCAGIKDVRAKSIGSNNTANMAYATLEGLKNLATVEKVAKLRGKKPEEILG